MNIRLRHPARWAAVGWLALLLPALRHLLESSMTAQMLLQLPLLAAVGAVAAQALVGRKRLAVDRWNHLGIAGLVLASLASAFWMLPRMLDASVSEPLVGAAKFVSVPLLVGLPFALSWPRMGFIVRGVLLLELIATLFRLGWLYLVAPQRLCSQYLLGDQQRLGQAMLVVAAVLLVGVAGKLMWGRFDPPATAPSMLPPPGR